MAGFDKNEFWKAIMSMYPEARDNDFVLKLDQPRVQELKRLFLDVYIPPQKLRYFDEERTMREMMRTIVSIYKMDKNKVSNDGQVVELVNTVKYDGNYLYIHYAKISPLKLRRFEIGKDKKTVAETMGYGTSTVEKLEHYWCDLSRQPENLRNKYAKALDWTLEEFDSSCGIV